MKLEIEAAAGGRYDMLQVKQLFLKNHIDSRS